jgi:hypothetical protein
VHLSPVKKKRSRTGSATTVADCDIGKENALAAWREHVATVHHGSTKRQIPSAGCARQVRRAGP